MNYVPYLLKALYIISILASTFLGQVVIGKILNSYQKNIADKTATNFDNELIPLLKRILSIGIWLFGFTYILWDFGISLRTCIATFGTGSLVYAFILKDSFLNIIAGVTIMFDKPFRVGDCIKLPSGEAGEVLKIGVRRTHIKILDNNKEAHLILTNADLSKCKIVNYTYAKEK